MKNKILSTSLLFSIAIAVTTVLGGCHPTCPTCQDCNALVKAAQDSTHKACNAAPGGTSIYLNGTIKEAASGNPIPNATISVYDANGNGDGSPAAAGPTGYFADTIASLAYRRYCSCARPLG